MPKKRKRKTREQKERRQKRLEKQRQAAEQAKPIPEPVEETPLVKETPVYKAPEPDPDYAVVLYIMGVERHTTVFKSQTETYAVKELLFGINWFTSARYSPPKHRFSNEIDQVEESFRKEVEKEKPKYVFLRFEGVKRDLRKEFTSRLEDIVTKCRLRERMLLPGPSGNHYLP